MKLPHAYTRRRAVGLLSAEAFRLHMLALDWCAEQKTNGAIAEEDISLLPRIPRSWRALTVELVAAGLWEQVAPGWSIVDWGDVEVDFDPPKRPVSPELSAKRAEAGRRGGLKAGETRRALAIDADNEIKDTARRIMARAIARGELPRGPCAVCGDARTDGHHTDYAKPLDVVWLCERHHAEEHARLRARAKEQLGDSKASNLLEQKSATSHEQKLPDATDPVSPLELSPSEISSQGLSLSESSPALSSSSEPVRLRAREPQSEVKASRKAKRTPAPEASEFVPSEATIKCAREVGAHLKTELVACFDHHRGKGSLMADWQAVVRTWLRSPFRTTQSSTGRREVNPPGYIPFEQRPESRRFDQPAPRRGGPPTLAFGGTKT